ncbi:phage tail protein [Methylobacterium sp. OT2]|uniref:phage tail protein n=1 Tax=Methylobacterium sp. OT2 TaxID=2813779 RepID=UPI00197B95E7|nr:phage tail protein [Methylobacterium sp. OT2]MBN4095657.1 tail fiber protein [Methylobacterium sp. OT2]
MGPHHWSRNPEENQTSDPNGYVQKNWSAKAMGPAVRGLMATAACARDDGLGTLLATLGANNVYTVATNEGLIDPATQINGLTPAITKPFIIRVVLPAMTVLVATKAPTIVIDGAAAVPLVRRDGSALADGDLSGVPVELLGDTITSGAYSRARILDLLPSDVAALSPTQTALPIGTPIPFTGTYIPAGFLPANGPIVNRADYPKLWTHAQSSGMIVSDATWQSSLASQGFYSAGDGATTFRLPHLGGVFIRGVDSGRGLDPNRQPGSTQTDAFRNHGHGLTDGNGFVVSVYQGGANLPLKNDPGGDTSSGFHAVRIANAGDNETRPVNVAYPHLIRAY